jgi:hypothetical protein
MMVRLAIFLSLFTAIFFNNFYAEHIIGKEIDRYCSRSTHSYNFLWSEEYRNCILDSNFRGDLIDRQIENKIKILNKARDNGFSKFEELNLKLMAKVDYIGRDKFIIIKNIFPSIAAFTNRSSFPPLIRVTFDDCLYSPWDNGFSCGKQIIPPLGVEIDGFWTFKADQLPRMDFMQFGGENNAIDFYIDLPTTQEIIFDFTVQGFEITKGHINKNINSSIQGHKDYLNEFR